MDPQGNFSIQVLRSALQNRYNIELPNIRQEGFSKVEPTLMDGFICNKQAHWFAIRKINGRYWNLNSMQERPAEISHFNVATEIDRLINDGYSVFCVSPEHPLPAACLSVQVMERRREKSQARRGGNWWREEDLLRGRGMTNGGTNNGSAGGDPWKNVGSGMRLDGKPSSGGGGFMSNNGGGGGEDWTQALTEEEQMQMAMAASLETPAAPPTPEPTVATLPTVPVSEEPAAGTTGAVRIQFRLPSKRLVRRFMETDSVAVVLSFCREQEAGKNMDILYGFPPKDLKPLADKTVAEAKLAGESIQGRYI